MNQWIFNQKIFTQRKVEKKKKNETKVIQTNWSAQIVEKTILIEIQKKNP